jgi:hypothetical protein
MADGLSIVIPSRNERRLHGTLRSIAATRGDVPVEVLVMLDGDDAATVPDLPGLSVTTLYRREAGGDASARDYGSMAAKNSAVLTMDSHCELPTNGWAAYLVDWVRANPRAIACATCVGLDDREDSPPDTWGNKPRYYGADVRLREHDGGTWRVCCDKWAGGGRTAVPRSIASPLGGAYVFSREWYTRLGRPWRGMAGWGAMEVTLAACNFLAGGTCWLLPVEIGHYFRSAAPYQTPTVAVLANQLRLLSLLPMPDALREELVVWLLARNPGYASALGPANVMAHQFIPAVGTARTWADLHKSWRLAS